MSIDCSNYLSFKRENDAYIYDKETSYLYPIDNIHYTIASMFRENGYTDMSSYEFDQIVHQFPECEHSSIKEHYFDVIRIINRSANTNFNSTIYTLQDIRNSVSIVPQILIEVTEQCNLQCTYCYYGKMYHNSYERKGKMNTNSCISALRELLSIRDVFCNNITISFYGGEPLLNFDLIRTVVTFCKDEFPNLEYTFSFTTNGTLIKQHIDFLVEHNFQILISLDGCEKNNINRLYKTQQPSFEDVHRTVEYLFGNYHDYFTNNVNFISVLHSKSDIVAIGDYFSKFGKAPILTNLSLEGIDESQQSVFPYPGVSTKEMEQLCEINREVYNVIKEATESEELMHFEDKVPIVSKRIPRRGCELFANKIYLAADERIYLCEKSSRDFPFGDFKTGQLSFYIDTINGYYKQIREGVNTSCVGCAIKMLCKKCFFAEPSLLKNTGNCRLSEPQIIHKIINNLNNA